MCEWYLCPKSADRTFKSSQVSVLADQVTDHYLSVTQATRRAAVLSNQQEAVCCTHGR